MGFIKDELCLMTRLQVALAKEFAIAPPPISPNQDDSWRTDAPTLPYVATNTGD